MWRRSLTPSYGLEGVSFLDWGSFAVSAPHFMDRIDFAPGSYLGCTLGFGLVLAFSRLDVGYGFGTRCRRKVFFLGRRNRFRRGMGRPVLGFDRFCCGFVLGGSGSGWGIHFFGCGLVSGSALDWFCSGFIPGFALDWNPSSQHPRLLFAMGFWFWSRPGSFWVFALMSSPWIGSGLVPVVLDFRSDVFALD